MAKAIILGIDGCDPKLLAQWMGKNQLPNFSKLAALGSFRQLKTATPPETPVAWSSIATGGNPGKHGLFDFIHRDPTTYLPKLSTLLVNRGNILGKRDSMFKRVRGGKAFWELTSRAQVPTTVLKWPITFPPEKIKGQMLSGLGVPDLKTTLGRYTVFTSKASDLDKGEMKGEIVWLKQQGKSFRAAVKGPLNTRVNFEFKKTANQTVELKVCANTIKLRKSRWTNWLAIRFKNIFGQSYAGMCRFYLVEAASNLTVYMSSIHPDPEEPAFPISYPDFYSQKLAQRIGKFHTLGLPDETNGLVDGWFDREAFLELIEKNETEKLKIFWQAFEQTKGLFAFVFDELDMLSHMFWFTLDPKHPIYQRSQVAKYKHVLLHFYKRMDNLLGKVLGAIKTDDLLLVISDHGFSTFRRAFHLNSWLVKQGLMALKGKAKAGGNLFEDVDWKKTSAYALGFASIYLNLKGREKHGVVEKNKALSLKRKITDGLIKLKDGKNRAVDQVYDTGKIYTGEFLSRAPDLVLGTRPGFRASWQTAAGAAPKGNLFEDNLRSWCGDHLIDPKFVPGILLINRKKVCQYPDQIDIAPTILKYFGLKVPNEIDGQPLI